MWAALVVGDIDDSTGTGFSSGGGGLGVFPWSGLQLPMIKTVTVIKKIIHNRFMYRLL
jgi:hypothetical protein